MKENDIPSLIYYPNPLHRLVAFKNVKKYNQADFNNTEKYASCNLGLPFSPYILEEDQGKVIDIMHKSVREFRAYKCKEGR